MIHASVCRSKTVMILTCTAVLSVAGAEAQQPTFRSRTDVVSVVVSVMHDGRPVAGLDAADFELLDNGVRQTVDSVAAEEVPIDLTLLLTSYPPDRQVDYRRGISDLEAVRQLLRPTDQLRLIRVREDIRGEVVAHDRQWTMDEGNELHLLGEALVDGLFYALAWPVPRDRRHLIVAFTDGWDTWSTLELERLPALAAQSDAVLHVVSWATPDDGVRSGGGLLTVRGSSADLLGWKASYRIVSSVAAATGGAWHKSRRAAATLTETLTNFRSSYVLHYTPHGIPLPGWHDITVCLERAESVTIRARKGYEIR